MQTRRSIAVALLLAACGAPRPRTGTGETVLTVEGKIAGGAARFGQADLAQLPRRTIRATDPRGGEERTWSGVAVQKLLGDALEVERNADVAIFRGKDGYEAAIPLSVLQQNRPVLADTADGVPLAQALPGAAPLVLVWPTVESPGLTADPRARWWWVDGVTSVDVRPWLSTYGRALRVPPGAAAEARPGAEAFQNECMMCHRVRGAGGKRGPELTELLGNATGREKLDASLPAHRGLAGAAPVAGTPAPTVRAIAAFLKAVAVSGAGLPQDEPPEPPPAAVPPPGGTAPRPPGMGLTPRPPGA